MEEEKMVQCHNLLRHLMAKSVMLPFLIVSCGLEVTMVTITLRVQMILLTASSFVDMYEVGEYVYTFFREITNEINPAVSRNAWSSC